jgi:transcriptional regulator with XRE-family HTH domain
MTQDNLDPFLEEILENDSELKDRVQRNSNRWQMARQLLASRKEAGLSQTALAERTGMDQAQISRMESVSGPSPDPASIHRYLSACGFVSGVVWGKADQRHLHVAGAVALGTSAEEELVFEGLIGQDANLSFEES